MPSLISPVRELTVVRRLLSLVEDSVKQVFVALYQLEKLVHLGVQHVLRELFRERTLPAVSKLLVLAVIRVRWSAAHAVLLHSHGVGGYQTMPAYGIDQKSGQDAHVVGPLALEGDVIALTTGTHLRERILVKIASCLPSKIF